MIHGKVLNAVPACFKASRRQERSSAATLKQTSTSTIWWMTRIWAESWPAISLNSLYSRRSNNFKNSWLRSHRRKDLTLQLWKASSYWGIVVVHLFFMRWSRQPSRNKIWSVPCILKRVWPRVQPWWAPCAAEAFRSNLIQCKSHNLCHRSPSHTSRTGWMQAQTEGISPAGSPWKIKCLSAWMKTKSSWACRTRTVMCPKESAIGTSINIRS